eukprot:TRINITY_DN28363_c0_g1_i1.p1 TRINITY_DN28363_c0_g1~~TRINITY_DN28363_c0_g1_i1.p1  ORF type:complete len:159 (-),score=13.58 TRINITY_DN28363_c0_g1_i1:188-664(-)
MIRRPPRSTLSSSSAASDVYKRQPLPGSPELATASGDPSWECWVRIKGTSERFDRYPDTLCGGIELPEVADSAKDAKRDCVSRAHCSGFRADDSAPNRFVLFTNVSSVDTRRGHTCYLAHHCQDFGCVWLHDNKDEHKYHETKSEPLLRRYDRTRIEL